MKPSIIIPIFTLSLTGYCVAGNVMFLAQVATGAESEERTSEPKIATVHLRFERFKNVSEETVRANLLLSEGMLWNEGAANKAQDALYRSGYFEHVEIVQQPRPDGRVDVFVKLTPQVHVREVRLEGNDRIGSRVLFEVVAIPKGVALNESDIQASRQRLNSFYQAKGYYNAMITFIIERDRKGYAVVIFKIREGPNQPVEPTSTAAP